MEGEYSADVGRSRQQTCGELSPALDELHPQEEMLQPPRGHGESGVHVVSGVLRVGG